MQEFKSTHNLDFYAATWDRHPDYTKFKVGTCHGLYTANGNTYELLAIVNDEPNNGHLQDVFDWFENSCKRDRYDLKVLELMNEDFKNHLVKQRGFKPCGKDDLIKQFR